MSAMTREASCCCASKALRTWFPVRAGLLQRPSAWIRAVDGVDLRVEAGRTLALVGESGCGKTTVGRSILRLVEPSGGRVLFEGTDLLALAPAALRPLRRRLQIVFQDPMASLDPRLRVRDAIAEGMQAFGIGADEAERSERVAAAAAARASRSAATWSASRTSSRAASASASASRARSRSSRGCSSATSRSPRSTCRSRRRS